MLVLAATTSATASLAHAQYSATAVAERPIPSGSPLDPTATATVVELDEQPDAGKDSEALVRDVPGARVRRTGPVGAFQGLSLRGTNLDQTAVLLGDLPLAPPNGGAFDLSTVPLELLERVEVYRGSTPLALGRGGIGGTVRLVPRGDRGTHASATLTGGSFGLVGANLGISVLGLGGTPAFTAVVGGRHSDGDFRFTDDRGTLLDETDDVTRRRRNAELSEGWALGHATYEGIAGDVEAVVLGYERTGGLTGSPLREPLHTRRSLVRTGGALGVRMGATDTEVRVTAGALHERNRLDDPFGEVGVVPRATDDRSIRAFARVGAEQEMTPRASAALSVLYDFEEYDPEDALAAVQPDPSKRHTVGMAAEARLRTRGEGLRVEARPQVGLDLSKAAVEDIREGRMGEETESTELIPRVRLGTVLSPIEALAVSAAVGTATRLPSLTELFGDRAFVLGNTDLEPERSVSAELALVAKGRAGPVRGALEARAFGLFVDDLIRYVRTAQFRIAPENVARATIGGVELGARASYRRSLFVTAALTWLRTRDHAADRELPLRPELDVYARPEVRLGPFGPLSSLSFYGDVTYVAANFADPANRVVIPARTLLGVGLALGVLEERVRIAASVRDLLDERPFDLVGFPLPGRSFAIDLTLSTDGKATGGDAP